MYNGRRVLYTSKEDIDETNIIDDLSKIMAKHTANINEIDYLYRYYKGEQPIRRRKKEIRPEICNKITENRANEIVSFKTGYLVGEPIQYVSQKSSVENSQSIEKLNAFLRDENKSSKDVELSDWQNIGGTAYRMILPEEQYTEESDFSPFNLITLDPRDAFVVYSARLEHKPMYCGYTYKLDDKIKVYCIYTHTEYFEIKGQTILRKERFEILKKDSNNLAMLPIIEYPLNKARLGYIELVEDLLNAINLFDSNRLDAVEQFVQSLLVLKNCELGTDENGNKITANDIREAGLIELVSIGDNRAEIQNLADQLDQSQNQTLKDDMYQTVLTIVGMPSQSNGSTSDSSNNGAVILKNGWQSAEARAKLIEPIWKECENEAIKVMLRICRDLTDIELKSSDISIKFTRRNYEDISTKSNVLVSLLNNPKVAPIDAYTVCGLFPDPEEACNRGLKYYEDNKTETTQAEETENTEIEEITENGTDITETVLDEV